MIPRRCPRPGLLGTLSVTVFSALVLLIGVVQPVAARASAAAPMSHFQPAGSSATNNATLSCTFPSNLSCPHTGGPIPVGNGTGLPSSGPSAVGYNGLYWMSDVYTGSSFTASSVSTEIMVPSSGPRVGDQYFELLSVWDDNGYYDQIGLASVSTSSTMNWENLYSLATNCGSTVSSYNSGLTATPWIQPGSTVNYEMDLGGGNLVFKANGVTFASLPDSATHLNIANQETCGGNRFQDFTDYQEVHFLASGNFPQWDVTFQPTVAGATTITSWTDASRGCTAAYCSALGYPCPCVLPATPHGYWTVISGIASGSVQIANEAFEATFPWSYYTVAPGNQVWDNGSAVAVDDWCTKSATCWINLNCPSNWFPTGYGYGFTVTGFLMYNPYIPTGQASGWYYTGCTVGIATSYGGPSYETTTWIFYIYVT